MTYEEAIKILGYMCPTPTRGWVKSERVAKQNEAVCLATIAISMQIPKKPIIKEFDDEDEETHKKYKWKFYVCSVCGENIALKSYTHCHCGQAIDWSDVK